MKKTAMIVAMSCALLCPMTADAAQCTGGQAHLLKRAFKAAPDGKSFSYELQIEGNAPKNLKELERDYQLEHAWLQFATTTGAIGPRVKAEAVEGSDSKCIVFPDSWGLAPSEAFTSFSDIKGGGPTICISASGAISSTMKVVARGGRTLEVRSGLPSRDGRGDLSLFVATENGCSR